MTKVAVHVGFKWCCCLFVNNQWALEQINLWRHLDKVSPGRVNCDHLPLLELLQDTPQGGERAQILGPAAVPPWGAVLGILICYYVEQGLKNGIWSLFQWGKRYCKKLTKYLLQNLYMCVPSEVLLVRGRSPRVSWCLFHVRTGKMLVVLGSGPPMQYLINVSVKSLYKRCWVVSLIQC